MSRPTAAARPMRRALGGAGLAFLMACSGRHAGPQPPPADAQGAAGDADLFAFGQVVAVGHGRLKILEYDFAKDDDVVVSYQVSGDMELGNLTKLEELKPNDQVVLDYVMRGTDRVVGVLVKEITEGGDDTEAPPKIGRIQLDPAFQQIGQTENGGGILRSITGMLALMTDNPAERERLTKLEHEPAPPAAASPAAVDLTGIDRWLNQCDRTRTAKPCQARDFGSHRLRVWRDTDGQSTVALWLDNALQFAFEGHLFVTTGPTKPMAPNGEQLTYFEGPPAGTDLDRDGVPDLLLYDYSGGAHCCSTIKHIVCSDPPVLTAQISGWHDEPCYKDVDGDGRYEMLIGDTSYAYWNACYAASPRPQVIFRIRHGHYELAGDLMRKRALPADEVRVRINNLRHRLGRYDLCQARWARRDVPGCKPSAEESADDNFFLGQGWRNEQVAVPPMVWDLLLDLIYRGQVEQALSGLDTMWPQGKPGKDAFARDLFAEVAGSWFGCRLPWFDELESDIDQRYTPKR